MSTTPERLPKHHQNLLVRGDRAAHVQYPYGHDINYLTVEAWVEEQLGMQRSGTPWSWLNFPDVSPASVRYRDWLEGAAGAGFELLKSQSITGDQIEKTKRWLKANRDVVVIKVCNCTIHPKCLIYLPPNPQAS